MDKIGKLSTDLVIFTQGYPQLYRIVCTNNGQLGKILVYIFVVSRYVILFYVQCYMFYDQKADLFTFV